MSQSQHGPPVELAQESELGKAAFRASERALSPGSAVGRYRRHEAGILVDRETGELQGEVYSRSVEACAAGWWDVLLWPRSGTNDDRARPELEEPLLRGFRCKSWRCDWCRGWVGMQDYQRIRDGIAKRDGWLYVVLTFDQRKLGSRWQTYQHLKTAWRRLLGALKRRYRLGGKLDFIWTLEQHASGWPHLNVLFHSAGLLEHALELGTRQAWAANRGTRRHGERHGRMVDVLVWGDDVLRPLAVRAGYGPRVWAEPLIDGEGMARYYCKLADELISTAKQQTPVCAPLGFRRYDGSRRPSILPRRREPSEEWTGRLVPSDSGTALMEPWKAVDRWLGASLGAELAARWTPAEELTRAYPTLDQAGKEALTCPREPQGSRE